MAHSMQPAPLTGTATLYARHFYLESEAGCNPHPSRGRQPDLVSHRNHNITMQPAPLAGTATCPRRRSLRDGSERCNPCPSRGRQQPRSRLVVGFLLDATRTPRGDGNVFTNAQMLVPVPRCNPHPSRGQQLNGVLVELLVVQMQPAPLRRLWKKRQEAMASCLFFPSWLSPTAGPTAT